MKAIIQNKSQILMVLLSVVLLIAVSCSQKPKGKTNKNKTEVAQKKKPSMDIHTAVFMGNKKALEEHIAYESDLNAKDAYGSTALNVACTFGKTDLAKRLIEAGADLNVKTPDGGTALHTAAFFCRTDIVKAMLAADADKTVVNNYGATALQSVLAPYEHVEAVYKQFAKDLSPLGLRIDFKRIEATRPQIAKLLQ